MAFSIVHFNESNQASKLRSGNTLVLCVHVLFYNSACSLSRYSLKRMAFQDHFEYFILLQIMYLVKQIWLSRVMHTTSQHFYIH